MKPASLGGNTLLYESRGGTKKRRTNKKRTNKKRNQRKNKYYR
jgi:hypothetical protein